ncbi:MAG: 3-deoxy-D-manno-octulosonic acid transferase [Phenylobacterium sp.]|uniref:3-deoxy-D-manno-octulosonic acid transferase n=1 Tax=Phenylobacterium sp. TaxID=1871053 RepID=UPI002A363431|nr:3-deoxy-D-manno-octulosonic acid transferase [Phenylobacterium sp.]MDX9997365.1 3-deoxy-D-manno-octulosonic acid transferase [Phenylobacterium sp.]
MSGRSLALGAYRAATGLAEPFAPALLNGRARKGKEDPDRIAERLGRPTAPRPPGPLAWLHAVSVGEAVSLLPLVQALRARRADLAILVTSGTRTSADLLAKRLPAGCLHQYAPVDGPGAVARFLAHWRPDLGVFVESELWPNLILGARRAGVRLALLSARMTEASARGWSRAPTAAAQLLGAFELILAQDAATAGRLERLGARPAGRLNLKLVGDPLPCDDAELARLRGELASRPVVLAASTHPGEEALIVRAWKAAGSPGLLIVAPRHPDRSAAVEAELKALGPRVSVRSRGEPAARAEAYLADTLGELGLFFRLARIVVMGGAFVPGIGGHNPLEPARLGCAIVTGPEVFNAADVYAEMAEAGAVVTARDEAGLAAVLRDLIADPARTEALGDAALAYAARQGAALDEALARLEPLLPA